jgi:hypothetical protein
MNATSDDAPPRDDATAVETLPPPPRRTVAATVTALMERISAEYTEGEPGRLAAEAREDFLLATGRVHEGDHAFDDRMAQFMEWFLLDRPLPPGPATPAEGWAALHATDLEPTERALLMGLCTSHRSLFCLVGTDDAKRLVVDDLLSGIRWAVTAPQGLAGVDADDVYEGRLLGHGGEVHFTAAFCYHPREAAQRIRHHMARVRDRRVVSGPSLLNELMTMRLAYDRSEGAPVNAIYRLGR